MKKMSKREKVMMGVLMLLLVCMGYYYIFYIPINEKIASYETQNNDVEDQIFATEILKAKMDKMQKELDVIFNEQGESVKELPAYDNSQNVMNSLSNILVGTKQYNVSFSGVTETDGIIRRDIKLNYSCNDYASAKNVLEQIYNGEYRCLLTNMNISQSNGNYSVTVDITYFEYQ